MRTTKFPFHNDQTLEIFVRPREKAELEFEMWLVGEAAGRRMILDHLITQDNIEARLGYAQIGDLNWEQGDVRAIPSEKTKVALEYERECLDRGLLRNSDDVSLHLHTWNSLPLHRKTLNQARKRILGSWSDGIATLILKPQSQVELLCADSSHPLSWQADFSHLSNENRPADWWNFSAWLLFLMNQTAKAGSKQAVWRCDETELHLPSLKQDIFAHVYHRISTD